MLPSSLRYFSARRSEWIASVFRRQTPDAGIGVNLKQSDGDVEDFSNIKGPRSLLSRSSDTFESFRQLYSVSFSRFISADD